MQSVGKGSTLFSVALGVLLVGVIVAYLLIVARQDAAVTLLPPPGVPVANVPAFGARLESSSGKVEIRTDSGWAAAEPGSLLGAGRDLRTAPGAKAALTYGDAMRIEVGDDAEVRLAELNDKLARLVVGRGFVFADVKEGSGRAVQFTSRDGGAVAETRGGALRVSAELDGKLRAAALRGEATVTAAGQTVRLQPGFFSVVARGEKPSAPTQAPRTLLLKVKWPDVQATAKRRQKISGIAAPGARVRVGDTELWADEQGRFQTVIDLREGQNRIRVQAVDIMGRTRDDASPPIELDTSLPAPTIETNPDMWRNQH